MPVFDENDKGLNNLNLEGLTKYMEAQSIGKKEGPVDKMRGIAGKTPWLSILLLILILIVGIMALSANLRLSAMRSEIDETRGMRAEIGNLKATLDAKLDSFNKEKAGLKSEIAQLRNELATIKGVQKKVEAESTKKPQQVPARKKAVPKKPSQKDRR